MQFFQDDANNNVEVFNIVLKRDNCLNRIRPFYDADIIKILTGSRRSGKSKIIEFIIENI